MENPPHTPRDAVVAALLAEADRVLALTPEASGAEIRGTLSGGDDPFGWGGNWADTTHANAVSHLRRLADEALVAARRPPGTPCPLLRSGASAAGAVRGAAWRARPPRPGAKTAGLFGRIMERQRFSLTGCFLFC